MQRKIPLYRIAEFHIMANLQKLHQLVLEHLDSGEEILHSVFGRYKTTSLGSNTLRNGAFFATKYAIDLLWEEKFWI